MAAQYAGKFPVFYGNQDSLPCSQELTTGFCPKPPESISFSRVALCVSSSRDPEKSLRKTVSEWILSQNVPECSISDSSEREIALSKRNSYSSFNSTSLHSLAFKIQHSGTVVRRVAPRIWHESCKLPANRQLHEYPNDFLPEWVQFRGLDLRKPQVSVGDPRLSDTTSAPLFDRSLDRRLICAQRFPMFFTKVILSCVHWNKLLYTSLVVSLRLAQRIRVARRWTERLCFRWTGPGNVR
jgi:hypothetical protein